MSYLPFVQPVWSFVVPHKRPDAYADVTVYARQPDADDPRVRDENRQRSARIRLNLFH